MTTPIYRTFEKLLLHPGVLTGKLKEFLTPIITAAEKLCICKCDVTIVVFFDEVNTCKCLGTLKEIICDHRLDGKLLPRNIFFTAATNPFTGVTVEETASSDFYETDTYSVSSLALRRVYHVFPLLDAMKDFVWIYHGMREDAMGQFLKAKTDVTLKPIVSSSSAEADLQIRNREDKDISKELRLFGRLVHVAHTFCETRLGVGTVSQRDIKRVFELVTFFWKYLPEFWNADSDTTGYQNLVAIAVLLSVGIVYYLRLSLDQDGEYSGITRSSFAAEIDKVLRTEDGIENVMTRAIEKFVTDKHFRFPKGIALTRALRENIFTIVACVISKVPLGIIGTPGSSKTLSVYIVRDNLRGNQSHTEFCKKLPPIDVIAHQCSEYSTSEEIRKTFEKAEKRQKSYGAETESSTRCLVFLDEAGLPKEKLMVLKVIHPFLDNPKVSFVAISNFEFDAANTNRMVTLRRSLDQKDLEVLALGCLGLAGVDENSKVCQFAKGLAQGFRFVRMDPAFRKMFHYRDFIYTLLYIRSDCYISKSSPIDASSSVPSPTVLLNALEENMNGVERQEFQRLFEIFFDGLQAVVGRDYAVARKSTMRSETQILSTMLERSADKSLTSGEKFGSRFVMIIDPAEDETSTVRMLFDSGLLSHGSDERHIQLLTLSDFENDVTSLADTETLAKMRFALDTSCTAVLQNTSRIHGALYDLFNQTFSIMAEAKVGETEEIEKGEKKAVYATIAIGELTYPCRVDPNFKCVVLIQERELASTPSPFLSRFSKFRLSAENFLNLQLEQFPPSNDSNFISEVKSKVWEFLEEVGQDALFGISDKDFVISQVILEEVKRSRSKNRDQANLDEKTKSLLRGHSSLTRVANFASLQFIVSVCASLLQLAPPEIAILGIQNIIKPWRDVFSKIYFEIQEHFSLEGLIDALHVDNCNNDLELSMTGNKLFVYCRSLLRIQDLCERFKKAHTKDWCVLEGKNIVSVDKVKDFLLKFIQDVSQKVALVVVPARLASQVNKMRVILQLIDDAYEYISGRKTRGFLTVPNSTSAKRQTKSFVLMLPHDPDYECGDTVHPAQFLDGWNTFFVDLSANAESVDWLKGFVQEAYSTEETHSVRTAFAKPKKRMLLSKCIPRFSHFCEEFVLPLVHEDFENDLCDCSRTLHAANTTLQEKSSAMKQIMQQCPHLAEVIASRFCSIPTIELTIPEFLGRLALAVYAKEGRENICALVTNTLKRPYLAYCSRFLGQLAANFGLSAILDWCSDTSALEGVSSDKRSVDNAFSNTGALESVFSDISASESVQSLLMIIPSPCKEIELPLLHSSSVSVRCDVNKPYKTPFLDVLAAWLEDIVSEETLKTGNEGDMLRNCQDRIDAMLNAEAIVRTIEKNEVRRSQWIGDLIQRKVTVDGSTYVNDDVLSVCNTFVTMKSEAVIENCSKFLTTFWIVHCNSHTLIYLVRSCRALHHLGLLTVIEFKDSEPHRCEETFWLQTLRATNKALIDGEDRAKWMAAVSLILSTFPYMSRFQSKKLHAVMRFMFLFSALLRTSGITVDDAMLEFGDTTIAAKNRTYKLARILQDLSAVCRSSDLLSDNIKSAISEVLFLYLQFVSVRERTEDIKAQLLDVFANGFKLQGTGHEGMTVRLDSGTVSSLLKLQNDFFPEEFKDIEDSAVDEVTVLGHTNLRESMTEDSEIDMEALGQQASDEGCFVLSTVLRLFPVLKELRITLFSLAFLQTWIYEELQFYAESLDESLQMVTDRFLHDSCCSEVQRKRISHVMESVSRAASTLTFSVTGYEGNPAEPQFLSMPLKFCLKTNESNGYLFEIAHEIANVQADVVKVLKRYVEVQDSLFDWTLLYGNPPFRYPTSLSQIVATEGSTLISIDERRFHSLVQYCSFDEHDTVGDFHRLEKLVIEMFLGQIRDIDMSTLTPTVTFAAMGQVGSRMRSLTTIPDKDVKAIVQLFISCLLKLSDSQEEAKSAEEMTMKNDVVKYLSRYDQIEAEYFQRLQPYRAARITLRDCADVVDKYPNQTISETLQKKAAVDAFFSGSLLSRLPDSAKGKHRRTVLKLIVRKESSIRAEAYKNKTSSEQFWSPISDENVTSSRTDETKEREADSKSDHLLTMFSHNLWKASVDYSPAGMIFLEALVENGNDDESDSSSLSGEDTEEQNPSDTDSSICEEQETERNVTDAETINEQIDRHALRLWTEKECAAQASMKYLVSRIDVSQQPLVLMEDFLTDDNKDVFEVYSSLRSTVAVAPKFFCQRRHVRETLESKIFESIGNRGSEGADYYFTNSVGLVLSEEERPSHGSRHCSLYLAQTKVHVIIELQSWKQNTWPLAPFATIEKGFASQATVSDLLAASLWHAQKFCEEVIDFDRIVLHDQSGVMIEDTSLTVMELDTELRSTLYCTFGCPHMLQYKDSFGKLLKILPSCFQQCLLPSRKTMSFSDLNEMNEKFLVWNCQVGTGIEDVTCKDSPVYLIPRETVFSVSLSFRGCNESTEPMNLPLLHTSQPQSICNFTRKINEGEDKPDIEQWQLQKIEMVTDTNKKRFQRLSSFPLGWSCSSRDKLALDVRPLVPKIQLDFKTEGDEYFSVKVVWRDKPSVSTLLEFFCLMSFPKDLDIAMDELHGVCLVDVDSNVVLTDDDDLIAYATAHDQKVRIEKQDVAIFHSLPVLRYNYMSKEMSFPKETLSFKFHPNSTSHTSWQSVREFLALRQCTIACNDKGPFHCGCPPFLTFSGTGIIIDVYSNFQELVERALYNDLTIGFWEALKPDDLISMEVSFSCDHFLSFKVSNDTAQKLTVRGLLKCLTKMSVGKEGPSFLTLEEQEMPLSESLKLIDVVKTSNELVKLSLKYSDSLNVTVKFEGSAKFVDMPCNISYNDAIKAALGAFNVRRSCSEWTVSASETRLSPMNEEISYFEYLEEREIAVNSTLEIEPTDNIVWVGRLGLQHLEQLEHPYYSTIDQFRVKAAEMLGLDCESCQLVAGDVVVSQSDDRLEEILELCTSLQLVRDRKPIVYLFHNSMTVDSGVSPAAIVSWRNPNNDVNQRLECDFVGLEDLISECAPTLWSDAECKLLAVQLSEVNVKVWTATHVKPMERVCTDDNEKKIFTVEDRYLKVDDTQNGLDRQIICRRSELEAETIKERRRENSSETATKLIFANQEGLVLMRNETPQSKKFVVLDTDSTCRVKLNFRDVRKSTNDDWNYESLFRGDKELDDSKSEFSVVREVSVTCKIQTVASMAVMLWSEHVKNTELPPIVIHCGDGLVPDANDTVKNFSEAERSNLWCAVGCKHSLTLMDATATVVPDHFPLRLLQNYHQTSLESFGDISVDDYFVWPSYRMLIKRDQTHSSSVFVLPRSRKAVFVAAVIKENAIKQHLAVMATTTCHSVLQYLEKGNNNLQLCLRGSRTEEVRREVQLLPHSLPLGHVRCLDGTLPLHLFDKASRGKSDSVKLAEDKNMIVSVFCNHNCVTNKATTGGQSLGYCLVHPLTRCRLPNNRFLFPKPLSTVRNQKSKTESMPVTMRSLNLSSVEIVQNSNTIEISLPVYRYYKERCMHSDVETSKLIDTVKVSMHNTSGRVRWQAVAGLIGSTVETVVKGPFNCAQPPFLALTKCDSKCSIVMSNPQLDVQKFLDVGQFQEGKQYELHVGYCEELEIGPLMTVTVIQSYSPYVTIQFQAFHSQTEKLIVRDIMEAVCLHTGISLSSCILRHCDKEFRRDDTLSSVLAAQGLVGNEDSVCLKLQIVEKMKVRVTFNCLRNSCSNDQVSIALSDRKNEIIRQSLAKFEIEDADPEIFDLFLDREDDSEMRLLSSSDSLESILEESRIEPVDSCSFAMKQKKTLQVKVQQNDDEIFDALVEYPLFSTVREFCDDVATYLKAEGLTLSFSPDISLYVSYRQHNRCRQVIVPVTDDKFKPLIKNLEREGKKLIKIIIKM